MSSLGRTGKNKYKNIIHTMRKEVFKSPLVKKNIILKGKKGRYKITSGKVKKVLDNLYEKKDKNTSISKSFQEIKKKKGLAGKKVLGKGGFSQVGSGINIKTGQKVAIKIYKSPDIKMLEKEKTMLEKCKSDNILQVYDFGQYGDFCFLITENLSGGSLDKIHEKQNSIYQENIKHKKLKKPQLIKPDSYTFNSIKNIFHEILKG
ncbi:protein kinase, partial [Candidatus Margulisiibacteriota bacterium]